MQFESVPDGWAEIEYDVGPSRSDEPYTEELSAMWTSDDEHIAIRCRSSVSATGEVSYPIRVQQVLEAGSLSTMVQTDATVASDRQDAESKAREFMASIDRSKYDLRAIAAVGPDENNFIQFFAIYNSELPGDMTGEQLVELIDANDASGNQIADLPDDVDQELADSEMIQIEVFPRYKEDVDGYTDNNE